MAQAIQNTKLANTIVSGQRAQMSAGAQAIAKAKPVTAEPKGVPATQAEALLAQGLDRIAKAQLQLHEKADESKLYLETVHDNVAVLLKQLGDLVVKLQPMLEAFQAGQEAKEEDATEQEREEDKEKDASRIRKQKGS